MSEKKISFEEALQRLEQIVSELERGDIVLDDMIKIYEEGTELIKFCLARLDDVEKKINLLSGESSADLKIEPFDA
jgi:exodeoxyribonuclease VII small subunit